VLEPDQVVVGLLIRVNGKIKRERIGFYFAVEY